MAKKNGSIRVLGTDSKIEGFIVDKGRVSHKATRKAAMMALRATKLLESDDFSDIEEAEQLLMSVDAFYGSQVVAIPDDWWSDDRPQDVDVDSEDFMEYVTQTAYEKITEEFRPEIGAEGN